MDIFAMGVYFIIIIVYVLLEAYFLYYSLLLFIFIFVAYLLFTPPLPIRYESPASRYLWTEVF